jgi:RNA polymerase sigma factor (sigma-70 family)
MATYSDAELLDLFHNGGNPGYAFNLMVVKYREKVYWHIRRLVIDHEDANDLTQDVFFKAWKGLNGFRADSGLFTWLYRIASNESLSFLKKKKMRYFLPWQDYENILAERVDSGQYLMEMRLKKNYRKQFCHCLRNKGSSFNLRYYDEMKYEEMSEVLDTSVGALKASYHHAVKKVEEHLKNH